MQGTDRGLLTVIELCPKFKATAVRKTLLVHCMRRKKAETVTLYVFHIVFPASLYTFRLLKAMVANAE